MRVLMVAEKPSIAQAIAKALSKGGEFTKSFRTSPTIPVFDFRGTFKGSDASICCTSTTGHVFETDFGAKYNQWDQVDPTELFDAPIVKKEANPKNRCVNHLVNEASQSDYLVLWLDCDREGENICFEVLGVCLGNGGRSALRSVEKEVARGVPGNVYRVKFSSLVTEDLRRAYQKALGRPNILEAEAVDARQELDLKIGVVFTRFLTKYFLYKFSGIQSNCISYGPCQLPTLWFCVNQQDKSTNFVPRTYHLLQMSLQAGDESLRCVWSGGRLFDESSAKALLRWFSSFKTAAIIDVTVKKRSVSRPLPLNTVSMLKKASTIYGIGPQRAMHCAESLYLKGLITYPRTESTSYPNAFNLKDVLQSTLMNSMIGSLAAASLLDKLAGKEPKPKQGVDCGDHPPITPCGPLRPDVRLDGDEQNIYTLVVNSFLQSISTDAIYEDLQIKVVPRDGPKFPEGGIAHFVFEDSVLKDPGFLAVGSEGSGRLGANALRMTNLKQGQVLAVQSCDLVAKQTTRPGLLSESALLGLMEKHGIGTDASMAQHIQNIQDRKYVTLMSGRTLQPTQLGRAICIGLGRIDSELTRPVVRALIEKQCDNIAKGLFPKPAVVIHVLEEFRVKFQYVLRNISIVEQLFEISFSTIASAGSPLSRCGGCNRYLSYVQPGRLFCKSCSVSIKLPHNVSVSAWTDARCPFDNYEIILAIEAKKKAFPICPVCFTTPPYRGMIRMKCMDCPNVEMPGSKPEVKVADCVQPNCDGILYIQNWPGSIKAFTCSNCPFFVEFLDNVKSVKRSSETCADCGWRKALVGFKGEADKKDVCLGCGEDVQLFREGQTVGRRKGGRRNFKREDPKMTFDRF